MLGSVLGLYVLGCFSKVVFVVLDLCDAPLSSLLAGENTSNYTLQCITVPSCFWFRERSCLAQALGMSVPCIVCACRTIGYELAVPSCMSLPYSYEPDLLGSILGFFVLGSIPGLSLLFWISANNYTMVCITVQSSFSFWFSEGSCLAQA